MSGITKRAKAGGKARAWQERKDALLRHKLPRFRKNCGHPIPIKKRVIDAARKQFCNRSCATSWNNKRRLDEDRFITVA